MTPKDVLLGVRELLSERDRWTQWVTARNSFSATVPPSSAVARCWCLLGAITMVSGGDDDLSEAVCKLIRTDHRVARGVAAFNDSSTHEEVLAVLDTTILLCP